ncbi:hypothetical protein LguiB_035694 [Lonicera macranthoides]
MRGSRGRGVKLFVFGDSYADTGNWPKDKGSSWKEPYGTTFPGKPSGRFSDGRVLTDYIASFVGIRSPVPYNQRKSAGEKWIRNGMNFAHGGTGVFNTLVQQPNMTTQINLFQQLVEQEKVYTKQDLILNSSLALVSLGGNDYATYMALNGTLQDLGDFSKLVIKQLELNLKRIQEIGVKKIGVTSMEPLGCLPQFTASTSYQNCSESENSVAEFHNEMLEQSLDKLNNITTGGFVKLDLYKAFMSALNPSGDSRKSSKFENPLKPCCVGECGSISTVDEINGRKKKKYSVCENPKLSFFWDTIHPSNQGWHAVSSVLLSSLHPLF